MLSEALFGMWEASWVREQPALPSALSLQLLLPELTWLGQGALGGSNLGNVTATLIDHKSVSA